MISPAHVRDGSVMFCHLHTLGMSLLKEEKQTDITRHLARGEENKKRTQSVTRPRTRRQRCVCYNTGGSTAPPPPMNISGKSDNFLHDGCVLDVRISLSIGPGM